MALACSFCFALKKNKNSLTQHQIRCSENPNRRLSGLGVPGFLQRHQRSNQYIKAKSYGDAISMSKETRDKISKSLRGTKHTDEFKQKMSDVAKARRLGGVRQSRWIDYNGVKLGSTYEVTVAKELDAASVQWIQPKRINYIDPHGKVRSYTPDFYLPAFDVYLDPKNDFLINNDNPSLGFSDLEKIKLVESQNNVRVLVLNKNQLTWEAIKALVV